MKKLPFILGILMGILAIALVSSFQETVFSPSDKTYELSREGNLTLWCNITPNTLMNVSNITLWTNLINLTNWTNPNNTQVLQSTWTLNHTILYNMTENTTRVAKFNFTTLAVKNLSYDIDIRWACQYYEINKTVVRYNWSAIKTVYMRRAPTITINPTIGNSPTQIGFNKSGSRTVTMNFTIAGEADEYYCSVWDNGTNGNWTERGTNHLLADDVATTFDHVFPIDNGHTLWTLECWDKDNSYIYGWHTANYTIEIDTTDPVITVPTPADGSYITPIFRFQVNVSDVNVDACLIYSNIGNYTSWVIDLNASNMSMTSETSWTYGFNGTLNSSAYTINVYCNDTIGNYATLNMTVTLDDVYPRYTNIYNYSRPGTCNQYVVNWTTSEDTNASLYYYHNGLTYNRTTIDTDFSTYHELYIVNLSEDYDYFYNITICDVSGKCNTSEVLNFTAPQPLCVGDDGWNVYTLYENTTSLGNLTVDSGAELVYWYNNTGQSWLYCTDDLAGSCTIYPQQYSVIHFYSTTNTTWARNITDSAWRGTSAASAGTRRNYSIQKGDNFLGIGELNTLGNFSRWNLRNTSKSGWDMHLTRYSNFSFVQGYNKTSKDWDVFYTFGWKDHNDTTIDKGGNASIPESIWIWSDYNFTFNGTATW